MLFEELKEKMSEELDIDKALIKPESELYADLGLDSLDLYNFIDLIEEEFNISIPYDEIDISTVQDVADLIERLQKRSA